MTDIFLYDNSTGTLSFNVHEILLVRGFAALYDKNRNKCKEDPKGEQRLRA